VSTVLQQQQSVVVRQHYGGTLAVQQQHPLRKLMTDKTFDHFLPFNFA
jgi:hypothetical protein